MKIAVVTGASSGMGRDFVYAIDREFEPDEIWVVARRRERLEELAKNCTHRIRPVPLDLTDRASFATLSGLLESEKPDIRVLVNAAGYGLFGEFENMGTEEQLGIIELNDVAVTAVCHICLPYETVYNLRFPDSSSGPQHRNMVHMRITCQTCPAMPVSVIREYHQKQIVPYRGLSERINKSAQAAVGICKCVIHLIRQTVIRNLKRLMAAQAQEYREPKRILTLL